MRGLWEPLKKYGFIKVKPISAAAHLSIAAKGRDPIRPTFAFRFMITADRSAMLRSERSTATPVAAVSHTIAVAPEGPVD